MLSSNSLSYQIIAYADTVLKSHHAHTRPADIGQLSRLIPIRRSETVQSAPSYKQEISCFVRNLCRLFPTDSGWPNKCSSTLCPRCIFITAYHRYKAICLSFQIAQVNWNLNIFNSRSRTWRNHPLKSSENKRATCKPSAVGMFVTGDGKDYERWTGSFNCFANYNGCHNNTNAAACTAKYGCLRSNSNNNGKLAIVIWVVCHFTSGEIGISIISKVSINPTPHIILFNVKVRKHIGIYFLLLYLVKTVQTKVVGISCNYLWEKHFSLTNHYGWEDKALSAYYSQKVYCTKYGDFVLLNIKFYYWWLLMCNE